MLSGIKENTKAEGFFICVETSGIVPQLEHVVSLDEIPFVDILPFSNYPAANLNEIYFDRMSH